jgi:sialate O-acetylesterase
MKNLLILGLVAWGLGQAQADVTLAPLFSSHMVLQRQMPVPIWGTAAPNESVTVTFRSQTKTVIAGADGQWNLKLDPLEAGGPDAMTVKAANTLTLEDVLVGEVWIGSGQSNMEMGAKPFSSATLPPPGDSKATPLTGVQNLVDVTTKGPYPQIRVFFRGSTTGWQESTPTVLTTFSAQLQCFGFVLHGKLNLPIGLISSAVGGSPSVRWIPPSAFQADPAIQAQIAEAQKKYNPTDEQAKYQQALQKYGTDLAAWKALPPDQQATLHAPGPPRPPVAPGQCQLPGQKIGDFHDKWIKPLVGYAIRGVLWDQGESGTAVRGVDQPVLMAALIKAWRAEWQQGDFPFLLVQKPSGGGCAFDETDPIYGWSADPFQSQPVILPPVDMNRLTFIDIAKNPNTFLVPTGDLGGGLHPVNKFAYGARDATVALGAVYHQNVEISGPVLSSATVEGSTIRLHFTHVGKGLTLRHGDKLQGFALAGSDRKFVWAQATLDGSTVVVTAPEVPTPAYVRYAWSPTAPWANLFNLDGLPALPFRTDPP